MSETWHLAGEMARRLGVSVKALRVYERQGLVTPLRTANGWRAYGPDQAARLHQVLALKALGFSLSQVAALLRGDLARLDAVLALQEEALKLRRVEVGRSLALLASARATLARHGVLTLDVLTTLTKETAVNDKLKMTDPATGAVFKPLIDQHFSKADQDKAAARQAEVVDPAGYDMAAIGAEWEALFVEAKTLYARGDETSPRAQELARRWGHLVALFSGGDAAMAGKARAVWSDAMADPDLAPRLPVGPEIFAFVGRITARMGAAAG